MENSAFFWLGLNVIFLLVSAFYSMMEMACLSFNRVRLHYYVSKKQHKALLLNDLLHTPSRLFGTTLIMVNLAMFIGSECSREFHAAIGLNPDLAPLSQVILVVIVGELAPMFAARNYSEHVAVLGIRLIAASSKMLAPAIYILELITRLCNRAVSQDDGKAMFHPTQEELQKILEEQEELQPYATDSEQFNQITSNIFSLRKREVGQVMTPIQNVATLPANSTIKEARELFANTKAEYLPICHQTTANILTIIFPRDLIRAPEHHKAREYGRSPWFVTESAKLSQILQQFRSNTHEVAVILNPQGTAAGIIHRDEIIEEVFGKEKSCHKQRGNVIINRTFPGNLSIADFNAQFGVHLHPDVELTLEELMEKTLGHPPEVGESIYFDQFELSVKETSLIGVKSIAIKTRIE